MDHRWHTFLGPRGWTSIRAVVKKFSAFSSSFFKQKGVDFYLDRFFGGSGWTSIRAWDKSRRVDLYEGWGGGVYYERRRTYHKKPLCRNFFAKSFLENLIWREYGSYTRFLPFPLGLQEYRPLGIGPFPPQTTNPAQPEQMGVTR